MLPIEYVFLLTAYTMSAAVVSMVLSGLDDSKLHTLYNVHKEASQPTHFIESKFGKNNISINASLQFTKLIVQDRASFKLNSETIESPDEIKKQVPILHIWRRLLSGTFHYSESATRTLNRRIRAAISGPLQPSSSESSHLFNNSQETVLDNLKGISDAAQVHVVESSHTRPHREIGSNTSSKNISDHHLKSHNSDMNMTFYKELLGRLSLEREIRHNAQVAFLCLSGLSILMCFVVWYNGLCRNRNSKYIYWDQRKPATTDLRDILYRRGKHLPMFQDEEYDVVYVKDRGTNT